MWGTGLGSLQDTKKQYAAYAGLIKKNMNMPIEQCTGGTANNPLALPLPFILFQVEHDADVEIKISEDQTQAQFDFHQCAPPEPPLPNPSQNCIFLTQQFFFLFFFLDA